MTTDLFPFLANHPFKINMFIASNLNNNKSTLMAHTFEDNYHPIEYLSLLPSQQQKSAH